MTGKARKAFSIREMRISPARTGFLGIALDISV
jgi:hypothetical protein